MDDYIITCLIRYIDINGIVKRDISHYSTCSDIDVEIKAYAKSLTDKGNKIKSLCVGIDDELFINNLLNK